MTLNQGWLTKQVQKPPKKSISNSKKAIFWFTLKKPMPKNTAD